MGQGNHKLINAIGCSAKTENLKRSIINPVHISEIEKFLKEPEVELLRRLYPDGNLFMWAFSDDHKKSHGKIRPGDILFLKEKGTGFFNYHGEIASAFEGDGHIGKAVWDDEKWTGLLFLKNIVDKAGIPMRKMSLLLSKKNPPNPRNVFQCPCVKEVEKERVIKLINHED